MGRKLSLFSVFGAAALVGTMATSAFAASNWSTAFCYTDNDDAVPVAYLGNPTFASPSTVAGTRPVILMVNIPIGDNPFAITGQADAGYYDSHFKSTIARDKTIIDMSAHLSPSNQPSTGVFMEVSLPILASPPLAPTPITGTITFRVGEDAEGFEGTPFGTIAVKCDLR